MKLKSPHQGVPGAREGLYPPQPHPSIGPGRRPAPAYRIVSQLLAAAGIEIGGSRPWDIQIRDDRFFRRVLTQGSLGLGESYMEGWWDAQELDQFVARILEARLERGARRGSDLLLKWLAVVHNTQTRSRALRNSRRHYDIGNDLYRAMLDPLMMYSCAYWKDARTLEAAQLAKLDLVCRKLELEQGMEVLDIGCGWGGFAQYAAERYGVRVVGITVSKEQAREARRRTEGLPVEIRLQDYRDVDGRYDRIASLGVFEHVGYRNYRTYMRVVEGRLREEGLFLLQTIGGSRSVTRMEPWIDRYIFPNSMLPSVRQIGEATEELLTMEDWQNFGADYDPTLMAWFHNFDQHWPQLRAAYGDRFYRMWKYYLLSCAATFRVRKNHLWQIVFSKRRRRQSYSMVR